jgi:hypothetical protein
VLIGIASFLVAAIFATPERSPQGGEGIRFVGDRSAAPPRSRVLASWCGGGTELSTNRPDMSSRRRT